MTKTEQRPAAGDDPTRMRDQSALTTSGGLTWLILGGLLAATSIAVLTPMIELALPAVAVAGILIVAALYVGMVVVRLTAPPGRVRLSLLAAGMLSIAAVALLCVAVITAVEWDVVV